MYRLVEMIGKPLPKDAVLPTQFVPKHANSKGVKVYAGRGNHT